MIYFIKSVGKDEVKDGSAIYFGIGVGNSRCLKTDTPFDALGMIIPAEQVKRKANLSAVHLLIADEHAKMNGFDSDEIDSVANEKIDLMRNIINGFGFENWEIHKASEIVNTPEYREIRDNLQANRNINGFYELLETSDIEWFRTTCDVEIKLGWMDEDGMMRDEQHFDGVYLDNNGEKMSFIYVPCGRDLNSATAVPYSSNSSNGRLLLKKDEDIRQKVRNSNKNITRRYWNNICSEYEKIVEPLGRNMNLVNKIEKIYGRIFG